MLGQGCLRALFLGTIYFHLKWVYNGGFSMFSQWAEMGPKVGQKWVFRCKSGSKCTKTHFCTHLKPIWGIHKTHFLPSLRGVEIVF